MTTLLQDIRFAVRLLIKDPIFTVVAVLTLALGVGANTAIFSVVNAVLLHSLPFPEPDRLTTISFNNPGIGLHDVTFSYPELDDLRSHADAFDQVSVVWPSSGNLTGGKNPERLELLAVSPNYFSMLGAVPQIGRIFGPDDMNFAGFSPAAVISDALWKRSYGSSSDVIGRRLQIDGDPYTIVGVLPPSFRHPGRTVTTDVEVWLTAGFKGDPFSPERKQRELPGAIGRLKSGLSLQQASARLDTFSHKERADYPEDYPANSQWTVSLQPLQQSLVGDVRPMLITLMWAVMAIVLIATLNIANLLLARSSVRQREVAMRLALGAKPGRVMRQMLTESAVLAVVAGVIGILTTLGLLGALVRLAPTKIPRLAEVRIDWTVLLFALAISFISGLLFGLAPARQALSRNLIGNLREGSFGSGYSAKTNRLRGALIISELALAVVLMVAAGLLLRTFWGLLRENPGFNPSQVVAANFWLPVPNDPKNDPYEGVVKQTTFLREVVRRIDSIPGIQTAAITSALPAVPGRMNTSPIAIEGRPIESSEDLRAEIIRVSPDYLKVMQTPLVKGRFFEENDETGREMVAVVDEATATRYWPNQDPVGRHVLMGAARHPTALSVVGVIQNIKHDGLDKDGFPHLYLPIYQRGGRVLAVAARTSLPAMSLEQRFRQEIQAVDPNLPVFNVRSMDDLLGESLAPRRFSAELVGAFALLALLLSCIGTYGLLAYMVNQRFREIGIRMAMGARKADILNLFLGRGMLLAGVGLLIGLAGSIFGAFALTSLLYGIRPIDLPVFLSVPVLLLLVSIFASYIPARRAANVDPMHALREG
ncbi:MAG TPA: ABC transporter permease [Candidatus Angelobacter sp.]|nr:ABC transporter permease [Candidatus Angelobacter sp.]